MLKPSTTAPINSSSFQFEPKRATYSPINALTLAKICELTYCEGKCEGSRKDECEAKWRVEVETQIKQGWSFPNCHILSPNDEDTQGFIMGNQDVIILAFRGTTNIQDWRTNLKIGQASVCVGKVHAGFWKALNVVWSEIIKTIHSFRDKEQPIFVTGHSLGGALATLATAKLLGLCEPCNAGCIADMALATERHCTLQTRDALRLTGDSNKSDCVKGLYTFGSPRVGDSKFTTWFDNQFKTSTFRFVNNCDIVTQVALKKTFGSSFEYDHVGLIYYFDGTGRLFDQILPWKYFKFRFRLQVKAEMIWQGCKCWSKAQMDSLEADVQPPSSHADTDHESQFKETDLQIPWLNGVMHLLTKLADHEIEKYVSCLEPYPQPTSIVQAPNFASQVVKVAEQVKQLPKTLRAITPRSTGC
jgi:triacylglycerol lipase